MNNLHSFEMEQIIESCRLCLMRISNSQGSIANSTFKEMCICVATMLSHYPNTKTTYENAEDCYYRYWLMFQFTQLISALELLANVITNECKINSSLKDCRKSVCERITFCLNTISDNCHSETAPISEPGCFLRWMNNALEKIREVDIDIGKKNGHKEFQEATTFFEDVLSHAMSIAQICLGEDCKAIKGSSHSVLEVLEDLKAELNKSEPNKAMVTLFIDTCEDKLCALERRVDIAVLRLSVKIFSQYLLPLEKIFKFCDENSGNVFDQQTFDNIVADFDLHVDRIMQIGLFAIFCSSDIKNGSKIRSCMASLEYLELEIIPVMQMLLSEDNEVNRASALILKNYWANQANKLKNLIFVIIDPLAFCQVLNDSVSVELDMLLESYKNEKNFKKVLFENMVQHGTVLNDFLLTAIKSEDTTDEPALKNNIKNCCVVIREITRAVEVLDDNCCETNERILKRCRVFKAQSKKLQLLFMKEDKKESEMTTVSVEGDDHEFVSQEEKIFENEFLKHIIARGRNILDNRSILYRTPNKTLQCELPYHEKLGNRKTVDTLMKCHKLNLSFDSSHETQSFEVNITEILGNLSNLSTTPLI